MRKIVSNTAMILLIVLYLIEAFFGYSVSWMTVIAAGVILILNLPYIEYGMNSMLKTVVILLSVQTISLAIGRGDMKKLYPIILAQVMKTFGYFTV